MTKKDVVKIADTIKDVGRFFEGCEQWQGDGGVADYRNNLVKNLADVLLADNPRFDRAHFYKACGAHDLI